jgi:hypothetical protein
MNDVVVEIVKARPVTAKLKEVRLTADDGDDDASGIIERSSRINTTIVEQGPESVHLCPSHDAGYSSHFVSPEMGAQKSTRGRWLRSDFVTPK